MGTYFWNNAKSPGIVTITFSKVGFCSSSSFLINLFKLFTTHRQLPIATTESTTTSIATTITDI